MGVDYKIRVRFWSKVDRSGGWNACWPWKASLKDGHYGAFGWFGRVRRSHQIAYILSYNVSDIALCVLHSCDNSICCNPKHLHLGTQLQNIAERQVRNRTAKGNKSGARLHRGKMANYGLANGSTKLTIDLAISILSDYSPQKRGSGSYVLARKYRVSKPTILSLVRGTSWLHRAGLL